MLFCASGIECPFIWVDLARFLPSWAASGGQEEFADEELSSEAGCCVALLLRSSAPCCWTGKAVRQGHGQRWQRGKWRWCADPVLGFVARGVRLAGRSARAPGSLCCIAYYRSYAVAAAACGQMTLAASFAHKHTVLQVAMEAPLSGRTARVGLLYDTLMRQRWAEKSAAGVLGFSAEAEAQSLERTVLHLAEAEWNRADQVVACRLFGPVLVQSLLRVEAVLKRLGSGAPERAQSQAQYIRTQAACVFHRAALSALLCLVVATGQGQW